MRPINTNASCAAKITHLSSELVFKEIDRINSAFQNNTCFTKMSENLALDSSLTRVPWLVTHS